MIRIRKSVWALCLVSLFTICSASKAQTVGAGTTGNLIVGAGVSNSINSGWQGNVNLYPDMDGGWSNAAVANAISGNGGANGVAIGSLGPQSINFGANFSTIWQNINVKNALNSTATGLQVNGFTYSMNWKNGNNWDNAMTDKLYTFVNVIDSKNRVIDSKNYNLSYNTGSSWWQSSWTDTFRTPYAANQLKTIQFGFQGQDNNGNWYGYYGPELANVTLKLNYSVDPCVANPLAHANCSGYSAALAKLSNPTHSAIATAGAAVTPSTTSITRDVTNTNYTSPNVGGGTLSSTGIFKVNDGRPQAVVDSVQSYGSTQAPQSSTLNTLVSNPSSRSTDTSQTVEVANPQVQTQQTRTTQSTGSAATPQSNQSAVQQSTQIQQSTQQSQQLSNTQQFTVQVVRHGGAGNGISYSTQMIMSSMEQQQQLQQNAMTATYGFSNNPVSISSRSEATEQTSVQVTQQEQPQVQQMTLYQPTRNVNITESKPVEVVPQSTSVSVTANKSNPVSELLGPKTEIETQTEVKAESSTVKTTVVANDLAGGVDTSMLVARAPGFDKYTNTSLIDAPFYKTDSIYKNQFVVDNARAQRLLGRGSELKWQQIVDSQYKIGE